MPPPTITLAGQNGTFNASTNPLNAPSAGTYNQAAGNTILLVTNSFNNGTPPEQVGGSIQDIAGNSFTQVFGSDVIGDNTDTVNAFYCTNCKGSAVNAVVFNWGASVSNYKTVWYFDIANASNLDVVASTINNGVPFWTTTYANEAIVYLIFQDSAAFTSVTVPSTNGTWTQGGSIQSNYGASCFQVFNSIQTHIDPAWTWGGGGNTTCIVVGFGQTVSAAAPNLRMLMGVVT